MNVLRNNKELLKYIEIWDKIVDLFNKKHNERVLYNNTIYNDKNTANAYACYEKYSK